MYFFYIFFFFLSRSVSSYSLFLTDSVYFIFIGSRVFHSVCLLAGWFVSLSFINFLSLYFLTITQFLSLVFGAYVTVGLFLSFLDSFLLFFLLFISLSPLFFSSSFCLHSYSSSFFTSFLFSIITVVLYTMPSTLNPLFHRPQIYCHFFLFNSAIAYKPGLTIGGYERLSLSPILIFFFTQTYIHTHSYIVKKLNLHMGKYGEVYHVVHLVYIIGYITLLSPTPVCLSSGHYYYIILTVPCSRKLFAWKSVTLGLL